MEALFAGVDDNNNIDYDNYEEPDIYITYGDEIETEIQPNLPNPEKFEPNHEELDENPIISTQDEENLDQDQPEMNKNEDSIANRIKEAPRERKKPTLYGFNNVNIHEDGRNIEYTEEMSHIILQMVYNFVQTYTINKGIKKFGDQAINSLEKEIGQIHFRNATKPIKFKNLTQEQKKQVIDSLIFLTEKRDGLIKSRLCADGRKQRNWLSKVDTSSPTAALESLLVLAVISAKERCDIITIDIPNAFIQTDQDTDSPVFMRIKGRLCKLLVNMFPEVYQDYVIYEKGVMTLYVQLMKALYGTLQASLLYYQKWVNDITEIGFELNPYDPCVANRIVNRK